MNDCATSMKIAVAGLIAVIMGLVFIILRQNSASENLVMRDNGLYEMTVSIKCNKTWPTRVELIDFLIPIVQKYGYEVKNGSGEYLFGFSVTCLAKSPKLPQYLTIQWDRDGKSLRIYSKGDVATDGNRYSGNSDHLAFKVAEDLNVICGRRSGQ